MAKQKVAPDPNVGRNIAALMAAHTLLSSQPALAKRTGIAQSTIGRILRSESNPSSEYLRKIADAFGVDVGTLHYSEPRFRDLLASGSLRALRADPSAGWVAHDLSQARNIVSLPRHIWEGLMDADLSQPFELEVIDDALGPDIFRGCIVRLDPQRKPEAGRPVLVRDREKRHYLRDYQVGPGGRWQAVARQRGYVLLDSEEDGLQLVAVMKGYDWP